MPARLYEGERVDFSSTRSFEDMAAALERAVPRADMALLGRLVAAGAAAPDVEKAVHQSVGEVGFLILASVDQGPVVSLLGRPKKIRVYLIGNPVLANRMFEHEPGAGLYAPLRVSIYEDQRGISHFAYDRPSSLLEQFEDEGVNEIARILDRKMAVLADQLVSGSTNQALEAGQ